MRTWGEVVSGKAVPVREGRRTCLFMGISHDVMTAKLILEKASAQNADDAEAVI